MTTTPKRVAMKRANKLVMEKRRRERINTSLEHLKEMMLQTRESDPAEASRLEKADILEMAVKHLKTLQRHQLNNAACVDPTVYIKYHTGFRECADEVANYLTTIDGVSNDVHHRLLAHLHGCLERISVLPHTIIPPPPPPPPPHPTANIYQHPTGLPPTLLQPSPHVGDLLCNTSQQPHVREAAGRGRGAAPPHHNPTLTPHASYYQQYCDQVAPETTTTPPPAHNAGRRCSSGGGDHGGAQLPLTPPPTMYDRYTYNPATHVAPLLLMQHAAMNRTSNTQEPSPKEVDLSHHMHYTAYHQHQQEQCPPSSSSSSSLSPSLSSSAASPSSATSLSLSSQMNQSWGYSDNKDQHRSPLSSSSPPQTHHPPKVTSDMDDDITNNNVIVIQPNIKGEIMKDRSRSDYDDDNDDDDDDDGDDGDDGDDDEDDDDCGDISVVSDDGQCWRPW